jgi:protein SCO1/2
VRNLLRSSIALPIALAVAACGGGGEPTLTGFERTPAPQVGELSLPDLSNDGDDFAIRADPGELLLVYFGYTNCPDFCPTTLSDVKLAKGRLDDEDAARVNLAMVTIDPARDTPVLADYVNGFVAGGHALATDDPAALEAVAAPFGVTYSVTDVAGSDEPEVTHSTWLYAVNDAGELVLTWQFGVPIDALATDLEILLDREDAA